MTLRQFEYLVAVVDTGSFTRAAALLHVSQPALSNQVRALERDTGRPLLERLPRSVRLTPMGRALVPHARAALADAERGRSAARSVAGLEGGEIIVASVYSVTLGVLPPVLRAWRAAHPSVRVRLLDFRHADLLHAAMTAGTADLAVGPAPVGWDGPVHALGVEEFVVVDGGGNAPLSLAALASHDWVHYAPDNGLADVLDHACLLAGFQPRVAVRTEQTAAAPVLAAAGLGPALVPANLVPPGFTGGVHRTDPPVSRALTAYTRPSPDPLTTAFVNMLAMPG